MYASYINGLNNIYIYIYYGIKKSFKINIDIEINA